MSQINKPVLIVEDDEVIRESLAELLSSEGYETYVAENGKVALQRLGEIGKPCVILLDMFMPEMDGLEFLKQLHREQADVVASLPILVLTAAPLTGTMAEQVRPMVEGFIKKPADLDDILRMVGNFCR